jgi:hypothetical protein
VTPFPQLPSVLEVKPGGMETVGRAEVVVVEVVRAVVVVLVVVIETGGGDPPPWQVPKSDWHPAPQYAAPEPHQKNSEQQDPKREPAQVVVLPHMPLMDAWSVPDGAGADDDVEVEVVRDDVLVLVVLLLVLEVVDVVGCALPSQYP